MISSSITRDPKVNSGKPIQVLVVDDSAIIRGFICRYLSEDSDIEIVTTSNNGQVALRTLESKPHIEVVVLDIEMPVMDGLTALPKMLELNSKLQVVMASTLTKRNAEVSLRALQYGAVDYVPKPETTQSINSSIDFRREIVEKVKAWGLRQRKKDGVDAPKGSVTAAVANKSSGFITAKRPQTPTPSGAKGFVTADSLKKSGDAVSKLAKLTQQKKTSNFDLRRPGLGLPKVLAIGSSTGGPQALMKFFKGFKKKPTVPVVITQHMPATFTAILASHIKEATGWESAEAKDGDILKPGQIYVAPGDYHMLFENSDGAVKIKLDQGPQENFCRPAVDPMYRSLIEVYGNKILGVILTGMGHDGLKGAREIVKEGGTIFAQDEASSVVWGMPGAVATASLCAKVLPIDDLGQQAEHQLAGGF